MRPWKTPCAVLAIVLVAGAVLTVCPAADDKPADSALTVVDGANKEQKIKSWKVVAGTRKLGWLAPAPADGEKPKDADPPPRGQPRTAAVGPEAYAFRDDNSTNYKNGILTLIPLESLRAVEFDADEQTATVKVMVPGKDAEESLSGTTKFGDNKLTVEAEVDKGDLGVAEVKFLGGVKGGARAFRFAAPKAVAALPAGRTATVAVVAKGAKQPEQTATDLRPLYQFADGSEKVLPTLFFKKTLKIDIEKVKKLAKSKGEEDDSWAVTLDGEEEQTFTLLPKPTIDGQAATLLGLVGRVSVGWKLYPMHTIEQLQFEGKAEAK
jgi:hypothetical protein